MSLKDDAGLPPHSHEAGKQPDVSILVVGYNSAPYLEACVRGVSRAVVRHDFELLFVNNGGDGSEEFMKGLHPAARVLPSRGNIGFAAANNYLADHARGRWLLLLNPDTELHAQAIDLLLDAASDHSDFQVLGGVTVGEDGEPAHSSLLELPSLVSILRGLVGRAPRFKAQRTQHGLIESEALTGGFMMVERSCWNELEGMDPAFFLYAEELDFFKRLKDRGGRAAQVAASQVYHEVGSGEIFSPTRMQFKITGRAHYLHKHYPAPYAYTCITIIWATLFVRYAAGRLFAWKNGRYARMADSYSGLVRTPWTWSRGYNSPNADPRRKTGGEPTALTKMPHEATR